MKKILSLMLMLVAFATAGMAEGLEKLYVIGDMNGWKPSAMTEMTFNETTQAFEYDFTTEKENTYFAFGTQQLETDDWDTFNANYRLAIAAGDNEATLNTPTKLVLANGTIKLVGTGTYFVSVTKDSLMTITKQGEVDPEVIESYAIVGDFFYVSEESTGWDDDHVMTQDAENPDIYTLVIDEFAAEAKKYEYKLRANAKWGLFEIPASGNNEFTFGTELYPAGNYKLTFTANVSEKTLELAAEKIEPVKNTYTVKMFNNAGWEKVYAYTWTEGEADQNAPWPGVEMVSNDDPVNPLYVYTFEATAAPKYIIFNNGKQPDAEGAAQTADLEFVDGKEDYTNLVINEYTVKFVNNGEWENVYAYAWKDNEQYLGAFPGTAMTAAKDNTKLFSITIKGAYPPAFIIFNNGITEGEGAIQTADLDFKADSTYVYEVKPVENTYTASFYNAAGWEKVYAYTWTGDVMQLGVWPGTAMTADAENAKLFTVTITATEAPRNILFSNGIEGEGKLQTADLEFTDGKMYSNYQSPIWPENTVGFDYVGAGIAGETLTKDNLNFQVNQGEGKEDRTDRTFRGYKDYAGTILPATCQVAIGDEQKVDMEGLIVQNNRYLAVYDLNLGDKVTVYYTGVPEGKTPTYCPGTSVDTEAAINGVALVSGESAIASGDVIEITKKGEKNYIIMSIFGGMRIQQVVIQKPAEPLNTYTVKLRNDAGWENVYAYTWTEGEKDQNAPWPGVKMELNGDEVNPLYVYTVNATAAPANVIFNNGKKADEEGAAQTEDLKFINDYEYTNLSTTPKYTMSLNFEQLVLDNGTKINLDEVLAKYNFDYKIDYAKEGLDSLNDDKGMSRNEAFLGLKMKMTDSKLMVSLKAGSTLKVKFGRISADLKVVINGVEDTPIAASDNNYVYALEAADVDRIVEFVIVTNNKTVVFKQVMIDENIQEVTLPAQTKYEITFAEGITNGTVTCDITPAKSSDPIMAAVGATVTLTATPNEGYVLESLTVTGVQTNRLVDVTDNKFIMPADAVVVKANFTTATGIGKLNAEMKKGAAVYNMQGQRVEKAQKGLYIINGRKVVVK